MARTVRWRWPGERLLVTVPCIAEWPASEMGWPTDHEGSMPADAPQLIDREEGCLGVTDARLVFRNLERHAFPFRAAAWVFMGLAVLGYALGGLGTFPIVAAALAVAAWAVSRFVEVLGFGGGSVGFDRIVDIDRERQRIHGIDHWGVHYRLVLSGSDLELVERLLGG